jgi:Bacterial Ig-like domain (group 2)
MRYGWLTGALVALLILPGCGGGGSSSSSGGGGNGGGGGGGGGSSATLKAVTISPLGPGIAVGGNQQLTATGTFSDNSTKDVTTSCAWTSDTTSVATVGASTGAVAGVAPGVATITCTDSSVSPAVKASTAVNVTSMTMSNANLSGQYAVFITNAGTRGQSFIVASFTADGNGNITAGIEDINASSGSTPAGGLAVSGTYTVYPDGRGTLTLKSALGTNVYSVILSTDGPPATHGKIMLFGSTGVEVGTFELQDSTKFTAGLGGAYSFLMGGVDGSLASGSSTLQNPEVVAGDFTVTTGSINGSLDYNNNGTQPPPATAPITGTVAAKIDTNGRGTLQFAGLPAGASTSATLNFAYYIVNASKILLIQTDLQSTTPNIPALAGTAEAQTFTTPPATKSFVALLERSASPGIFASAGQWTFGATTVSGEMDVNSLGTTNMGTIANTSTYTISGARGTVTLSGTNIGSRTYVFYLTSDTRMYVLETDNKVNGGVAEQQTPTTTLSTSNPWSLGLAQLATGGNDSSVLAQLTDTSNNLAGIADLNVATSNVEAQSGTPYSGSVGSTIDANGRGTLTLGSGTNNSYGFYAVSPTKLMVFGLKSALTNFQAPDGILEVQ